MDHPDTETKDPFGTEDLLNQAVHVPDRTFDSHRKTGGIGTASYETYPIAPLKKHWHVPEDLKKLIPLPKSLHVHLRWWLNEQNVLRGQPLHPLRHALQLFTDATNEG